MHLTPVTTPARFAAPKTSAPRPTAPSFAAKTGGISTPQKVLPALLRAAPQKKILLAFNPHAGGRQGQAGDLIRDIQSDLAQLEKTTGIAPERVEINTQRPKVLAELLAHSAREYDRLIAMGGDGTVTQMVGLGLKYNLPVGIVPMGTGNRLAKLLGNPETRLAALQAALTGHRKPIDVMLVNGKPSVITSHVGITEQIISRTNANPALKKRLGPAAYAVKGASLVVNPTKRKYRLTIDNQKPVEINAYGIMVINDFRFGGFQVASKAKIDDGLLDVIVLGAEGGALKTLLQLARQKTGTLENPSGLIHIPAKMVKIVLTDHGAPLNIDADGDVIGQTPAEIELGSRQVEMIVPKKA